MAAAVATPSGAYSTVISQTSASSQSTSSKSEFSCELEIEYPSQEMANIIQTSLAVDAELQPEKVYREMYVSGKLLIIKFVAVEARYLRASFSAFMDVLVLATRTIEEFGPSRSSF